MSPLTLTGAALIVALAFPIWATPASASSPTVGGGDEIWGNTGARCEVGFNLHDSTGSGFLLTSGACGQGVTDWYADSRLTQHIATGVYDQFPGSDYAIAQYDPGVEHPSTIHPTGGYQQITQAADATVGESVTTVSSQTGVHSGTVTNLNVTVNTGSGTINDLTETNLCSDPADVGIPLFDGTSALGISALSNGDCSSGGETLYQPITPILNQYGLAIG